MIHVEESMRGVASTQWVSRCCGCWPVVIVNRWHCTKCLKLAGFKGGEDDGQKSCAEWFKENQQMWRS